ncbi:MAG: PQQ-dependent sugar dehydrogenase [Anaerosomatales bacterium]|nr:PQQ-dependent sugar dehydrogenase [Anaerosomatales bacterium]MDT8435061.1 PQQ-dependent sugar dehydrogenase [Anaerosomatales bacterium]
MAGVGSMLRAVLVVVVVSALAAGCARGADPVVVDQQPQPLPAEPTTTPEPAPDLAGLEIAFEPVAEGFSQPLLVLGAGDSSGRLFVAEKGGLLQIIRDGEVAPEPYLDLTDSVSTESERGLLGVAFPPDFAGHGRFYVSYTDSGGSSVISRFLASGNVADRSSEQKLLRVTQPYANHNGGHIVFGPDGYLYTSLGDGGSGGDPMGNGQDLPTPLGAMLRLDVGEAPGRSTETDGNGYTVPADNPFADGEEGLPEIWSYGLRNPWRFSFDRESGDLWIGDVGQNAVEEINFQPASSRGGENWGWNLFEGTSAYPEGRTVTEDQNDFAWPIVEYRHPIGRSVTGGYVYRGAEFPQMVGVYLYGDYVTGRVWGLVRSANGAENRELAETDMQVVSFGEDDEGELYVVDFGGTVYRIVAR